MADQIIVTDEGLKKLQEELSYLKNTKRKEVTEAIKLALSFGDLSENAEYDEAKTKDSEIEIAVQICGKLKATVWINVEMTQAEALAVAKADERVQQALEGKQIVKEIYIPGKIINIVAK